MRKVILILTLILFIVQTGRAQEQDSAAAKNERMEWWREARFGMFIHWGVYSVLGGVYKGHEMRKGGAEWIMNRSKIGVEEYKEYAKEFNPVNYDPDEWVRMAKEAGMKYIIITSKHHDGFALFDTKASDWNVVDATPYGKDLLKPLAEACRKYDMKLGFYYSQAQDWTNPGGAVARKAATEGWLNPDSAAIDAYTLEHDGHWDSMQTTVSMSEYIDSVAVPQVKELLTNYGDVAVLWWDTPVQMTDEYAEKLEAALELQPDIITNNRLKRPNFPGDTQTPEQKIPDLAELDGKDWESCMTMNGTWGYKSYDHNWKSTETLVRNLIDASSKDGNYLLNIGPKADGTFPEESIERLKGIGDWMKINSEAIYGTQASPLKPFDWGRCTMKADGENTILYLFIFDRPKNGMLAIDNLQNEIISAKLLVNNKELETASVDGGVTIKVPSSAPDETTTVIKVEVRGEVENQNTYNKKAMDTKALD